MNILDRSRLEQNISCNLIVIDNFYENPIEVRKFAIEQIQDYECHSYHPGKRSSSFAREKHKEIFNKIVEPFFGKITIFNTSKNNNDNGAFQFNTSLDIKTWIHCDNYETNWAAIIYLTPDAPLTGGTGFFRHKQGNFIESDEEILNNSDNIHNDSQDYTKWELVSSVGNVFNRLVLFRANQYHCALDYFGTDINNGRLIQVFFFATER